MASTSSSSYNATNAPKKYDVFISFRGEDTRHNFTSHLHDALKRSFLEVFRDDKKLEKGEEITLSLIQAIKDSSVSIIVFSQHYASSKWCLDELAQIMQFRKEDGQFVMPVFYKVDPSDVRNQTGDYKKAFEEHEMKHDHDKVNRWRAALFEAGNLSGKHCETSTDESNFIQEIVSDVSSKLERIYNIQDTLQDVIGIDEMIEPIEKLLDKFHKVGIWGMGGVGKTTMAKTVFVKLSYRYDSCCFLENVREKTERNGSEYVRNSLVSELLRQDMQSNPFSNAFVRRRLGSKKALVVLDDVDSFKQLEDLHVKICNFLREGSKIIITTRDMQLLRANGYEVHEAKGLSYDNSLQLFIKKAFRSDHPEEGFDQLIKGFVDYTQHNPLALKVMGSLVCSRNKNVWDDLLRKLRKGSPSGEIQKVLKLSYDGLDYEEQQIFLEIACLLKNESEEFVKELLESYDLNPTIGMQTLEDKALIVITKGKVDMHDLLQEMGHQIVREENIEESGKRSRLWNPNDILDVLKNCKGKRDVKGIKLWHDNGTHIVPSDLTAKTFNKMTRLRFLKMDTVTGYLRGMSFKIRLESISTEIRCFHWVGYPMKSLPSNFCAKNILELNLEKSPIETLWKGVQDLANLRRLKLQHCSELKELPDFSKAYKLEIVNLEGCLSLCYVHASILSLHSLISLDVSYCDSLKSLQSRVHLQSLKEFKLRFCRHLKEFSVSSKELTSLDLQETGIKELSPSIGRCSKLRKLNLSNSRLKNLPLMVLRHLTFLEELSVYNLKIDNDELRELFDHLHSLQFLKLQLCWKFSELPENITQSSILNRLYLEECCHLTELPISMRLLSKLQYLNVKGCTALRSIPELPPSLIELDATDCTSLKMVSCLTISSTPEIESYYGSKRFIFSKCLKLDLDTIVEQAKLVFEKVVHEKEGVLICYPCIQPTTFPSFEPEN